MLAGLKRRLTRKNLDSKDCDDEDKDDINTFPPPANYIKISQGKIQLVHQTTSLDQTDDSQGPTDKQVDKEILENRIVELEGALFHLQEQFKKNQCGSPTFEKELRQQLDNMNRVIKSKERKQIQTCREHKVLQSRFARQENLLQAMQQENRALLLRIRQYEHCLDDVMRKVVDAIVAEDNLREEVALLKSRVKDLEAQNAALSASPAKGRDEGYCTMSSGQPQPSNGHLEDLPEEPEQWLLPGEPCSTEMEDWSMSQEELAVITLDERDNSPHHLKHNQQHQYHHGLLPLHRQEYLKARFSNGEHDWLWNTNELLASTMAETDSIAESITQLLQQKIVYSEDEEVACTDFTNDFYKLVNIRSNSAHSLYSYIEGETDEEDDDDEDDEETDEEEGNVRSRSLKTKPSSPTPSEAGQAQLTSCSSSETEDLSSSHCTATTVSQTQTAQPQQTPLHPELPTENDYESIDEIRLRLEETRQHSSNQPDVDENTNPKLRKVEENPFIFPSPPPPDAEQPEDEDLHLENIPKDLNETACITEIIQKELRKPLTVRPPHLLVKSHSMIEEEEPSCILRNNQRREIESSVVRSGSVNCSISSAIAMSSTSSSSLSTASSPSKISKLANRTRLSNLNQQSSQKPANSWRRSNGWKRVVSPAQSPQPLNSSPKKDLKTDLAKSLSQKLIPTKIPTCLPPNSALQHQLQSQRSLSPKQQQQQHQQLQQQQSVPTAKKSKIPPPVPIRRSYAS